jgi:signal transduction histidine kinase
MDEDRPKSELIEQIRNLESKLQTLEGSRAEAVDAQRVRALREISSGISHNLNNLLTGMLLQAELIETSTADPEILECVRDIIRTGRRGADLVTRLGLALREDIPDVPHPIDLKTVVEEAVNNTRTLRDGASALEGREIELIVGIPDGLPQVMTTESGLIDMVIDLIRNAEEALTEGGRISVSAVQEDDKVKLTINDNGIGMDAHTLERATLPLFTTKNDVGSGLGLSTIEGMITAWGGRIDLTSTPGKGTTVILMIPTKPRVL